MKTKSTIPVALEAHSADSNSQRGGDGLCWENIYQTYLTTKEAAKYLKKSASWLTRQPDIPYLRGIPNTYKRKDLDEWYERNKFKSELAF